MATESSSRLIVAIVVLLVVVVVGLIVILLPLSFKALQYYEYGFRRRDTTGSVDKSRVYAGGLHLIGPDYSFKIFSATAHFLEFRKVTIFASDTLQVQITANLQYFLRPSQLVQLHEKYDLQYQDILKSNALDAMKGAATVFSTREFIHRRNSVENHLFKVIKERLGGTCCERNCSTGPCTPGCLPINRCTDKDYGLFVDVRYFQLHELEIPDELNQRFLQSLVLGESTITAGFHRDALIYRKETEALANKIENEARETRQNATATAVLMAARAQAEATAIVEEARNTGLRHLYNELGLTTQEKRLSFDYLRTLRRHNGINLAVNYNQLVSLGRSLPSS